MTAATRPARRGLRFPLVVVAAAALILLWIWLLSSEIRQMQMIYTYAVVLFGGIALLIWWSVDAARSRLARWLPLMVVAGAAVVFATLFRVKGITGDWLPVIEPRFGSRAPALVEVAPDEAVAPVQSAEPAEVAVVPTESRGDTPPLEVSSAAAAGPIEEDGGSIDRGASFPRFLGPRGDSTIPDLRLARDWAARPPRLLWRRPIGAGWSGFAIAGGRAVTLEQRGEMETVAAYDLATGDELWAHGDRAFFTNPMAGPGPRATPTLNATRVFTFGSTGLLAAYDLAGGQRLWQHDVPREHDAKVPEHGMTGSPLVVDGLVVVSAGGPDGHSLVAYREDSGELAWRGGDDSASYASPALLTLAGRRQIVVFNRASVAGHDPSDGSVIWTHPWPGDWPNVAPPVVVGDDRVLVSTGYGVGSKLIRVVADGDAQRAELLWETPRLKSKFANLALHDGFVYGLDDGVLTCLDPADGSRRWKGGRYGHGNLLVVGDLLLVQSERGEMLLIEATPEEHREVGSFMALPGKAWNPFALAGDRLLVRNDVEAALWQLPLDE